MLALTPLESWFGLIAGSALVVALLMILFATARFKIGIQALAVVIASLVLWAGLFLGAEIGYRAWQAMPEPPDEAYADSSPAGLLILGWIPAGVVTFTWWGFLLIVKFLIGAVQKKPPIVDTASVK